jgi:hypothetical protein
MDFQTITANGGGSRAHPVANVIIAGWTGCDQAALERHIAELEREGVKRPRQTPEFYRVGTGVLTQDMAIQVAGGFSSGEVEAFVLRTGGRWWVGAASDHTDRRLEGYSVTLSKQVCPKPVAPVLWPFDEVAAHWGELRARSWIVTASGRELYQDGTLARNRNPRELVSMYEQRGGVFADGSLMLCGTQPALGGIRYAGRFEFELLDPVLDRRIAHGYDIAVLPADLPEAESHAAV